METLHGVSPSVGKDDTSLPLTPRNPSNHLPVYNEDCVILPSPLMLLLVWGEWPPV